MRSVRPLYALIITLALLLPPMPALHLYAAPLTIDAEEQYRYAERLDAEGQYRRAAEEFDRFAFFFPNHPRHRLARFKSAASFFRAGENGLALKRFDELARSDTLDKISIEAYFMMTECYLAEKQYGQAVLQMRNLIVLVDEVQVKDRAFERIGWIRIDQMDWEGARRAFNRMSPSARAKRRIDGLDGALTDATNLSLKKPALAGTLSIIPGGGQLYCGRYEDALAAFLVNGALAWASYESFDNDLNALGGLLAFVGFGFYASNIYGAVSSAHKYNLHQKQRYGEELRRQHLSNHYSLEAPRRNRSDPRLVLSFRLPF